MASCNIAADMLNTLNEDSDAEEMSTVSETTTEHVVNQVPTDEPWENVDGEESEDEGILIVPPEEVPPPQQDPPVVNTDLPNSPMTFSTSLSASELREAERRHLSDMILPNEELGQNEGNSHSEQGAASNSDDMVLLQHPRLVIPRSCRLLLVLSFLLMVSMTMNGVLLYQQATLRMTLLDTKRDLFSARESLDRHNHKVKAKPDDYKPPVCQCEDFKKDDTKTLVDNCWISAKANVQLGSCVEDAKKNLQDNMNRLNKSLWNLRDQFLNMVNSNDGPSNDQAFSKVLGGVSFQGVRDAATMLMSGVAYAAAATLIVEDFDPKVLHAARESLQKGSGSSQSSSNRTP